MKRISKRNRWAMAALSCIAVFVSCNKEDPAPEPQLTENQRINTWILEQMDSVYYWNDEIPPNPNLDLEPEKFFESILSSKDRFSWIQESADELSDNLAGKAKSFGYEVQLYYLTEDSDEIAAVVLYTYAGSDAEEKGLQRGMWIGKVNGTVLDDKNYGLLFDTNQGQELSVGLINNDGDFVEGDKITVQPAEIQQDPIYLDSIYTYPGKKIGYVVYNSFIPAPADDESGVAVYDEALMDIFSRFKAQGVNELILDLRYNLGGAVSSAFKLAGYIMKGYQPENIFAVYEDNTKIKSPFPVSIFYEDGNPPNLGTLDRVYVLISASTASASELIINGLTPYMEVVLVGDDKTVGKNVASQTIYDDRNIPESQKIKYGLQPIVLKIYNSLGESDFEEGFKPPPELDVDENYKAFGDVNESFLRAALNSISPGVVASTEALRARQPVYGRTIGSSLDRKPGAGEMYINPGKLPTQE